MTNYLIDLTAQSANRSSIKCYGRENEAQEVMATLLRIQKNFPVLVGDPGVGKTTIVSEVARRMLSTHTDLYQSRVYELPYSCLASASPEETARIANEVIEFLQSRKNVILFLDEMHAFFRHNQVFSNLIKPPVAKGLIRLIGATTPDEFAFIQRQDPALARRMWPIIIREMSPEQTCELLYNIRSQLENHHYVRITDDALRAAVDMAKNIPNQFFPDKAIDLIDAAAARVRMEPPKESHDSSDFQIIRSVTEREIRDTYSARYGNIGIDPRTNIVTLLDKLRENVVGHDEALEKMVKLIRDRFSYRLNYNRPLASFIFAGPSGVGKSWTLELLAEYLFGGRDRITYIDLSNVNFSYTHLLGAPPGYIGSDRETSLSAAIKTSPNRIVVFTGLENAHQSSNASVLSKIINHGIVQDNHGSPLDFRQCIVVLMVQQDLRGEEAKSKLSLLIGKDMIESVDDVLVFNPLDRESIRIMVDRQIAQILSFMDQKYSVKAQISDDVIEYIIDTAAISGKATAVVSMIEKAVVSPIMEVIGDRSASQQDNQTTPIFARVLRQNDSFIVHQADLPPSISTEPLNLHRNATQVHKQILSPVQAPLHGYQYSKDQQKVY